VACLSLERYAFEVQVKTLNVKLMDMILEDVDAFVQDQTPTAEKFNKRYNVCPNEIASICERIRLLIQKNGSNGLRNVRNGLQAELNRPVRFTDPVN